MRFPSIAALAERARAVLLRFPWPLAAGLVAAIAAIIGSDRQDEEFWVRLCLVAMLGIPLTLAGSLLSERRRWPGLLRTGVLAAGVLALYWFLHTWPGPEQKHLFIRYLQLSAALHLLVAVLPFWGVPERNGFWQYNRRLFEGFLRAVLFSGVLFVGLAIALGALDKLFGVDIESETYLRLWFVSAFVVNTWIFLAAVPEDFEELETSESYPRALKVFTQYILTPLVAVYLVILTAYLIKIIVTGTWPSGWIGYLVSSVATVGILGFLLVYPLRTSQGEAWIRTFARWLFIGLIPAAAMFLLALWKRVDPYGLTELRFIGLLLGAWLLGLSLLYTVRRETGIRIIPVSLAVILFFTAFGPLGATALAVRSQANRIRAILEASDVRTSEAGVAGQVSVASEDQLQMSEALRFILERNAVGTVRDVFGDQIGPIAAFDSHRPDLLDSTATSVMASVGLQYMPEYYWQPADYFAVEPGPSGEATPITGFDYVVALNGVDSSRAIFGADTMQISTDTSRMVVALRQGNDTVLAFALGPLVDTLFALEPSARAAIPLRLTLDESPVRGMLVLGWLSAERREGKVKLTAWRGDLYLDRGEAPPQPAD